MKERGSDNFMMEDLRLFSKHKNKNEMKKWYLILVVLLTVTLTGISANRQGWSQKAKTDQQKPQKKPVSAVKYGSLYLIADSITLDKGSTMSDSIIVFSR